MEIQKITYDTKKYIRNDPNYPKTQTITDEDMNEIKSVVNNNAYKQDEDYLKLKNALINVETEESKSIHIEDASELPAKLEILGNQEQETREGYNLLNNILESQTINGLTVVVNKDKSVSINGTATANTNIIFDKRLINTLAAGTYTLKDCQTYIDSEENNGWWKADTAAVTKTFTETPQLSTHGFYLYFSSGTTVNKTYYPALVKGTEEKPYEQYGATPSPEYPSPVICLGSNTDGSFKGSTKISNEAETEEISKILHIQQEMLKGDYFIKEADGWKEVHTWGKIIFNGTEGWYVQNSENSSIFQWTLPATYNLQQATKEGSAFCNHFKQIQNEQLLKTQDGMLIIYQVDTSYIRINNSNITNVEDFKSWLQQKNSEGKPVYIFYKTITPTKLACTEEQSAVLEELNNLDLFKGVNNIITTEDIALLKLNYIADTKTYVDNKYNQLANQIQQVGKKL